jgi:hypothetical protein
MFDKMQKGVGSPCMYTELVHDRPQDKQMMHDWQAESVLILSPDYEKVRKVWAEMIKYAKNPIVVLRKWECDDNRRYEGDPGVYAELAADPIRLAQGDIDKWRNFTIEMQYQARKDGVPFPTDDQIRCHLVNEPNTNTLTDQIEMYTYEAIRQADPANLKLLIYNFGSGHVAPQVGGDGTSPNWRPYEASMRAAVRGGHTIGTHEYYNRQGVQGPDMLYWQTMRHYWAAHFLEKWGLIEDVDWWITEWGFEGLVNGDMPGHHGWQGVLSAQQYAMDWEWYLTNVACFVKRVFMYCSDLSDRVWWTFDPQPAAPQMHQVANIVNGLLDNNEYPCKQVDPPDPPDPEPGELMWPADGELEVRFGDGADYYNEKYGIPGHNGIDIYNDEGTLVVAVANGEVEWNGWDENYGWYLRVWHEQFHFHSFYAHLREKSALVGGSTVTKGHPVGHMGQTGECDKPHVHFEVRMGERYNYWDITSGYRNGRANPEAVYAAHGLEW